MTERAADQLLFSYGAMQSEEVQLDLFGHVVPLQADFLTGYTVDYAEFEDHRDSDACPRAVHPRLRRTGNPVDKAIGRVLTLTDAEIEASDEYQTPLLYRRISVTLASGRTAWVYVP
ncbi:gamma-glutamylcyclotransferase family protein [Microbacterium sp.]|uniref:gamma-glutamylcyclotransferase family protein n=1 Tax=Microbacterium sp. TaxID=51671 RepID=UPI0032216105